jgi:hypothetical protein|tara:strand:- start:63 stop:698 length:636 start_codon:yes stop_codon:yes gene_type:complete
MKQEGEEMKQEKEQAVNEHAGIGMNGHILIRDKETGEELVNKRNAIHYGNMANMVANALNNQSQSYIHFMAFGNGGTSVDTAGKVVYKSPRVSESFEASADLYSRSYNKVISAAASDPTTDKIEVVAGSSFTDLKVTCTLGYAEPSDQDLFDSSTDNDGSYVFDELALFSYPTDGSNITTSKMLTHVIFHPVQKSQNRIIEIIYTVRIQLS